MENYKQKYEAALEQAKQELKACGSLNCDAARQIFRLFPELKKSENERIKEELIHFLETCRDPRFVDNRKQDEWITWLEKQNEQKSFDYENVNIQQKDFALESAVEPKFKVGDWVVKDVGKDIFLITSYNSGYCTLEDTNGRFYHPCLPPNDEFHLWTIRDAKNGDILVCNDDTKPFIFEGLLDLDHSDCPVAYCGIDYEDHFSVSSGVNFWWTDENVKPATKEQRDILFQKMEKAGYKWDAEKKELTKL